MQGPDRSILAVVSDIVGDVQQIIRAEVRLARVEFGEELVKVRRRAMLAAVGVVLMIIAAGALALSAVWALAIIWPPWAAALAVGGGLVLIGGLITTIGVKRIRDVNLTPEKTMSSIRENIQWAKTRVR